MRVILFIGFSMVLASGNVMANSFEFAGLSLTTTPKDVAERYPNSTVNGSYVNISPKDSHDHIFGIELFGQKLSYRLRINFEAPDRKYPSCESIKKSIVLKHGKPTKTRKFNEEAMKNQYLIWELKRETVQLQCFMSDSKAGYFAEAIIVNPSETRN